MNIDRIISNLSKTIGKLENASQQHQTQAVLQREIAQNAALTQEFHETEAKRAEKIRNNLLKLVA